MIEQIRKRDGRIVPFSRQKIEAAINKAFLAVGRDEPACAEVLSKRVEEILSVRFPDRVPGVEDVQDIVEDMLIRDGQGDAAKAYILYRKEHARIREAKAPSVWKTT